VAAVDVEEAAAVAEAIAAEEVVAVAEATEAAIAKAVPPTAPTSRVLEVAAGTRAVDVPTREAEIAMEVVVAAAVVMEEAEAVADMAVEVEAEVLVKSMAAREAGSAQEAAVTLVASKAAPLDMKVAARTTAVPRGAVEEVAAVTKAAAMVEAVKSTAGRGAAQAPPVINFCIRFSFVKRKFPR